MPPRVKVQSTWRSKALFALAIILSGILAWLETADEREDLERAPQEAPAEPDLVEVEFVDVVEEEPEP